MMRAFALVALLFAGSALADEAPSPPSAPVFTFTKEQVEIIATVALQKRNEAAAEYTKWNDLLGEIQKQAQAQQPKPAEPKP